MWLLFIVVLLNGDQVVKYQAFNTSEQCSTAKVSLQKGIVSEFPSAKMSLTCFKLNEVGLGA